MSDCPGIVTSLAASLAGESAEKGVSIVVGIVESGKVSTFRVGDDKDCRRVARLLHRNEEEIQAMVGGGV